MRIRGWRKSILRRRRSINDDENTLLGSFRLASYGALASDGDPEIRLSSDNHAEDFSNRMTS